MRHVQTPTVLWLTSLAQKSFTGPIEIDSSSRYALRLILPEGHWTATFKFTTMTEQQWKINKDRPSLKSKLLMDDDWFEFSSINRKTWCGTRWESRTAPWSKKNGKSTTEWPVSILIRLLEDGHFSIFRRGLSPGNCQSIRKTFKIVLNKKKPHILNSKISFQVFKK